MSCPTSSQNQSSSMRKASLRWPIAALASTGSQFFVVTGENGRFLTNQFSVLGTVVSGQDAMDAIMEVEDCYSPGLGRAEPSPSDGCTIESVTIEVGS